LDKPATNGTVIVDAPVPILEGDSVKALGVGDGTPLTWSKTTGGGLNITVPVTLLDEEEYCWVFKIAYIT